MFTLALFGVVTGFVSGFFGIGGGTVLVPLLLLASYDMKSAVAISIMQMVFSSIYGSFLNSKKNRDILKDGIIIGFGGFCGGLLSGFIVPNIDEIYLKYTFLAVVIFSIYKVSLSKADIVEGVKEHNRVLLFIIGFFIGTIAMSIGVGGSVLLTPILAGYMYYNLKDASSLGLFFVIFSSIAGFISLSLNDHMLYSDGFTVGLFSLFGVYFGIKIKNLTHIGSYKYLILGLYIIILVSLLNNIFF